MKKLLLYLTFTGLLFAFDQTNAQEITNITAPDPVEGGKTEMITVDYVASAQSDIVISLQSTVDWTNYGSARVTVDAGTGSVNINLTVTANIPPAVDIYKVGAFIAPVGGGYPDRLHELNLYNIDAVAPAGPIDQLINVTAPTEVAQGETVSIEVEYEATQQRDITVLIQENGGSWAKYGAGTLTVEAGTGTINVDLPVAADIPVATGTYKISTTLVPVGLGWESRLDEIVEYNVSATIATAISNNQMDLGIKIFPNPASTTTTISSETNIKRVSLYALSGKLMTDVNVNASEFQLDLKPFSKGLYLLSVTRENGISSSKLVIK
ncbi:T9SS type A sorting domain-containing protein [Carboxylicivirga sp. M1479]|uniref:T9SS type A sorting domain-containing protein n=1 Tax=Carboxylicivirga sp. M1479 TaxID=2594476 RepID=UPI0011782386|nr:T9SS type A sorting domain-containing protein [Carboxylicivirga sp. M1479]TRX70382.1 T9SS type A sorting domain-containing protein [Carboxylicivirga sp. M1479]